jgi:hypothetical protein
MSVFHMNLFQVRSYTLKMEAAVFYETSARIYQSTVYHMPQNINLSD